MKSNTEQLTLPKYTVSFGVSLAVASIANGILDIAKEKSPALQDAMKKIVGHHWTTHSIVIMVLFIALGLALAQLNRGQGIQMSANRLVSTIFSGVFIGTALIVGFYLFGD